MMLSPFPAARLRASPPRRGLWARSRGFGRRGSAPTGSEVVRIPGLQSRPLGGGTSIGTQRVHNVPLRPAGRRVLPRLLPPVDGQVEQPIVVIHHLDATNCGPVSLEDTGSLSQVANDVHSAHPASNQE